MLFKPTVVQVRGVDGALYTLTDEKSSGATIMLRRGAKGLDAPSFDVKADEYPAIDGGFLRFARAGIREIFLPLTITGSTRAQMMALKRRFIASLNPKRGLVTLQTTEYAEVGGLLVAETPRVLTCFYASGMEGGEGSDDGVHWAKYGVVLRATNPYFQHPTRSFASFLTYPLLRPFIDPPEGANPFLSVDGDTPGKGLQLSSNAVWVDSLDLDNPGDVESQPRWEIRGPLNSRMSIVRKDDEGNIVSELRLDQAVTISPTEVLVIETTKGSQFVRRYQAADTGSEFDPAGGDSMWWALDAASTMWPIEPGVNHVSLVIDKPADMTPEQEAIWMAGNQPNASVSFLPSFMGI
ncbi:hypothetical protein Ssi03_12870 [Sphaerisporangium siamense]|uniref:Minor tail protein n=1 Tax=Sphaerisporangium siamense TaxID=795645 RepID=A0A7W7D9V8_9ACTN|nr:hypothetical protein [Sphaerisporangium siamense]MBB4702944.1 hypothetical protein [Sphaerisporangium siamense]GII83297.1 hypothetical protein Ssi03_12870 [Sphaerisporangium siamense]